jgi:protein-disulfide isomerase
LSKPVREKRLWPLFAGLALAVAAAVAVIVLGSGIGSPPAEDKGGAASGSTKAHRSANDHSRLGSPALGRKNAPVTIVEYADFQCPYCGKFARQVEPKIVKRYVESGQVKLVWRDFPYLGQESVNAALAARAAQAQGKFWKYHDLLYSNQGPPNSGSFSDAELITLAKKAHLNVKRFKTDFRGGRYAVPVRRDFAEGQGRGISGTPTFFINGKRLVGAQPFGTFARAIREAKAKATR